MDPASDAPRLGDYQLNELLAEGPVIRTWHAEQVSVRRHVIVDELKPGQPQETRDRFLADIRAKASVDHPLIGSVYEAVAEGPACFFARERLPGATLDARLRGNEVLRPQQLSHVIRRIAEANLDLESRGLDTLPLEAGSLHLDGHGITRIDNLAISGPRDPEHSRRDITGLGASLPGLVAEGQPGATRVLTLLAWMRGEGLEQPLDWQQVRTYAEQIEQQLAEPAPANGPHTGHVTPASHNKGLLYGGIAAGALVAAALVFLATRPKPPKAPPKPALPEAILVPAGNHPTPDGTTESLRAFRLAAHEVTIGQYAEFLDTLSVLARDNRERTFDHDSQPKDKTGHEPDDWANLYAAAKANGAWQGHPVGLDSPVVGVDWWDAIAYCEWKQGSLPTQEEWFAALRLENDKPQELKASNWLPVSPDSPDKTSAGFLGMAGSVSEWTRRQSANPANPLGEKLWVITGASYLKPANGALAREWTDNRAIRRPDLGFRLATDAR